SLPTQQRTTAPLWEACGIRDLLWIALENTLRTVESELRLHGIRCEQNKGRDRSRPSILIRVFTKSVASLLLRRERPEASASATDVAACGEPSPRFAGFFRE